VLDSDRAVTPRDNTTMLESERARIKHVLERLGLRDIVSIEYPEATRRPLDLVARYEDVNVLIRITDRVSSRRKDFAELKRATEVLDTSSLVIAKYLNREELIDGILYTRDKIGIVSYKTLYNLVRGSKVCIYERNGLFYVKIDGMKLRELRERRGLSLSQLAQKVGVSIKALYEYEQGKIDMSVEVAERFLEVFGEEFELVLEDVNIFIERIGRSSRTVSASEPRVVDRDNHKHKLVVEAIKHGLEAEAFDLMPSDIVLRYGDARWFLTLISDENLQSVVVKCRETAKLAEAFKGRAIAVLVDNKARDRAEIRDEIEKYLELYNYSEINNIIREVQNAPKR